LGVLDQGRKLPERLFENGKGKSENPGIATEKSRSKSLHV